MNPQGDQLHSGDRGQGVQRLQGVFSTVPDIVSSGSFCVDRIARLSPRKFRIRIEEIGEVISDN